MAKPSRADKYAAIFDRRYPGFHRRQEELRFFESCYNGGREWFSGNIFKYYKEGNLEFAERLQRAYRFNHTREVIELVHKYLFKATISRNVKEAPEVIKTFWKSSTRNGINIEQFMRTVAIGTSIGGRVAVVIDNNMPSPENGRALSISEAKNSKVKIYGYVVQAKDILDLAFDEDDDGKLIWIALREYARDDADPIKSSGDIKERVRLWTRDEWFLFEQEIVQEATRSSGAEFDKAPETFTPSAARVPVSPDTAGGSTRIKMKDRGAHNLGIVPVILADHTLTDNPYVVPGLIEDIAYLDRSIANYLSSLDAIIQDQTFSQLAIPIQSIPAGEDPNAKIFEMGTKRIFTYEGGQGTGVPMYIAPDPKQAGSIMVVINKLISEIYHTVGLAGERTKEDNSMGIDNSSGVAKAYDFERVNSLLLAKAQACEHVENQIVDIVCRWNGEDAPERRLVTYPVTFDVLKLSDDLVTGEALMKIMAPNEVRRTHMRNMIEKLFPQLEEDALKKVMTDIDKWLADVVPGMPPATFGQAPNGKPAAAPSRQGQAPNNNGNTKDTAKKPAAS